MKIIILLLFLGMIIPVFAQEPPLTDVTNQLENQINQDHLKKLDSRISNLENQPPVDDQFVSRVEYTKLMERLSKLEQENPSSLEFWLVVATFGAVVIAILALTWQIKGQRIELSESKKTRSANIANDYNKKLLEDRFRIISRIISLANDLGKPIQIGIGFQTDDSKLHINEFDLDNYLSELETLSLYVNDEVISVKYAYELFNNQIMDVFINKDILDYIEKSIQSNESNSDLWDNLIKAQEVLKKYKIKKLELVNI